MGPDGVFLSNGPGDPEAVGETYRQAEKLLGRVPLFGICLGHQMMAKAAGAEIDKLKFGHHGGNHPVQNLLTGRVEVTAQNHGFCPCSRASARLCPSSPEVRPSTWKTCANGAGAALPPLWPTSASGASG